MEATPEPFAFGDFTWLNGSNRQRAALLDSKYFTGSFTADINYNISMHHPKDHTNVGSTATFREGELNVSFIAFGGDFHYEHARARLLLQLGTRAVGVPRNDSTPLRGQFDLYTALRYVSEAYAGYHWDALNGINLDVGMFMSYVGLMSYNNFENWGYQPSYTSDNTPWFFTGARLQIFPSDKLKIESWLINGWQTYGMFHEAPGFGFQALWRPEEWISALSNAYVGFDTPESSAPCGTPSHCESRVRFHSDNSVLVRYYKNPSAFISQAAFSITGDIGFEQGGGVSGFSGRGGGTLPGGQNFVSGMAYNRVWFMNNLFAWTVGGGFMHNPGRYLVLLPTGVANSAFTANPGDLFDAWDCSTNIQYMPNQYSTWVLEVVHREANVPYFAGPGGVTSPNGYKSAPELNPPPGSGPGSLAVVPGAPDFQPDLRREETRIILALLFRM